MIVGTIGRIQVRQKVRPTQLDDVTERVTLTLRARFPGARGVMRRAGASCPSSAPELARSSRESLGALQATLSPADIAAIEEAVPASAVAGTRFDGNQMRHLDSER